jgi:sulfur-oxidizing protein SoxY
MNDDRRKVLKGTGGMAVMGLAVATGLFKPGSAQAQEWNKAAFATKSVTDTVKAMGGTAATESKDIVITSPDIAENGAVVPFTISSRLPKTESIALLVEKNPNALAAASTFPRGPRRASPRA